MFLHHAQNSNVKYASSFFAVCIYRNHGLQFQVCYIAVDKEQKLSFLLIQFPCCSSKLQVTSVYPAVCQCQNVTDLACM